MQSQQMAKFMGVAIEVMRCGGEYVADTLTVSFNAVMCQLQAMALHCCTESHNRALYHSL
jgi:hypothetical protein